MRFEQVQQFKALFEEVRNAMCYSQSLMNESFNIISDDLFDVTDLASSELETSMRARLKTREVLYQKKIIEALLRIEDGSFGCCEDCTREIGMGRLLARPTATLCIECKEEKEHKEHRTINRSTSHSYSRQFHMV